MTRLTLYTLCLLLLAMLTMAASVRAAPPADPEPAVCVEWGQAVPWTLTKCEDEDGLVCVSSTSGMLNCKWDY